jgi:hypothetical protein
MRPIRPRSSSSRTAASPLERCRGWGSTASSGQKISSSSTGRPASTAGRVVAADGERRRRVTPAPPRRDAAAPRVLYPKDQGREPACCSRRAGPGKLSASRHQRPGAQPAVAAAAAEPHLGPEARGQAKDGAPLAAASRGCRRGRHAGDVAGAVLDRTMRSAGAAGERGFRESGAEGPPGSLEVASGLLQRRHSAVTRRPPASTISLAPVWRVADEARGVRHRGPAPSRAPPPRRWPRSSGARTD